MSCWTVCLHNSRLGMAHPGHVMRTAQGDPAFYGLCPSSPAVRAYVTGMVAEITGRYHPDRIEVESPDFMGFAHGYHHEKDGLGLLPEDLFLLGVCFCDHCQRRAAAAGIDAGAARAEAAALLQAAFERELPEAQFPGFPAEGVAAFARHAALRAYLEWRREPVTSLMAEIRASAAAGCQVVLIDYEGSWWGGVDLPAIAPFVDGVIYCAYTTAPDRIAPLLAKARADLGPGKVLIAGFQVCHPEVSGAADLARRVGQARALVDGFNFYNLGLIPRHRLAWIGAALRG